MKILLYNTGNMISKERTGGKRRFVELARYLCGKDKSLEERGIFVDLLCGDNEDILIEHGIIAKYHIDMDRWNQFPNWVGVIFKAVFVNKKLNKQIKAEEYDAVIAFDVPAVFSLCLIGIKNIIFMVRKDSIDYELKTSKSNSVIKGVKIILKWILEGVCIKKSKVIIVQCEHDKKSLCQRHIITNKMHAKFAVQINNVNPSWVTKDDKSTLIEKYKEFTVCFIGEFNDDRKGQDLFLDAGENILNLCINIQFIVIGGGKNLEAYKSKYVHPKLFFMGKLENPLEVLKRCHLLVVPSRADSCPNTVMEGLFNNILVIGSSAGGIPEIIQNTEALFDLNTKSIENKILELYKNEHKYFSLLESQRHRRKELTFDWPEKILSIIVEKSKA